jgi:hypothetical protein
VSEYSTIIMPRLQFLNFSPNKSEKYWTRLIVVYQPNDSNRFFSSVKTLFLPFKHEPSTDKFVMEQANVDVVSLKVTHD